VRSRYLRVGLPVHESSLAPCTVQPARGLCQDQLQTLQKPCCNAVIGSATFGTLGPEFFCSPLGHLTV
jgi:hypothetical protein